MCNDCYKDRQDKYRQERWAEYKAKKIQEMTDSFTEQWNDMSIRELNLVKRLVKVFKKNEIREAEKGLIRDVLCKVIFKDMWFIETDKIVNDMLNQRHLTTSTRLEHKQVLLQYVPQQMEVYNEIYRNQAREKWNRLVTAANIYYEGREKLIGTPRWEDPFTHLKEPRWRLLSDRETLVIRTDIHEDAIESIKKTEAKEAAIVEWQEKKQEQKAINNSNENKASEEI